METRPDTIFHIALPAAWEAAQASGEYLPDHYATDGFIHCSTASQLQETVEVHFKGVNELRLIRMRSSQLGEALKWESSRNGEDFPHLYREIRAHEDVERVFSIKKDKQGNWRGWEALGTF